MDKKQEPRLQRPWLSLASHSIGELTRSKPVYPSKLDLPSKFKFHCKLDKPRIVDRTVHNSKGRRLKEIVWRAKLRMVEEVEELSPELEAHPLTPTEGRSLEYGEIKIDDTLLAKAGIHARLVSEPKGIRLRETGSVEPFIQPGFGTAGSFCFAAQDAIGTRACKEYLGWVRGDKFQREASLQRGNSINAPPGYNLSRQSVYSGEPLLAPAERQIEYVADNQPLRHILGGERPLSTKVMVVLDASRES